jgi:uncharacterized protein YndB with AHSA1/START domain
LARWWGPKGCEITVARFEFRPGGLFVYRMGMPGGFSMRGRFEYREIDAPERLVWVNAFADEAGNLARAPFFDGKWPLEVLNRMTLEEQGTTTTLTLRGGPINATDAEWRLFESNFESMRGGFGGTFDQLDAYLAEQQSNG